MISCPRGEKRYVKITSVIGRLNEEINHYHGRPRHYPEQVKDLVVQSLDDNKGIDIVPFPER